MSPQSQNHSEGGSKNVSAIRNPQCLTSSVFPIEGGIKGGDAVLAIQVVMPQMGYDMEQGTVVRWLKLEGDQVKRGEPLAEIETDKAVVEMEALASGVLRKILAPEGTAAPVGQAIGIIGAAGEDISGLEVAAAAPAEASPTAEPPAPAVAATAGGEAAAPAGDIKASPVARRLAQEKGIDLSQVTGTGPGGRITREDVLAFEAATPAPAMAAAPVAPVAPETAPPATEAVPGRIDLSRMRQAIARGTAQSKGGTPHFYVTSDIDMTAAMELRRQLNETLDDTRITVNDLIVKAAAMALQKFPALNSFYRDDHLETHPYVNIGIAIALEQGLIVPAIANCESKSLMEIARASKDLVERAQQGRLRQEEYASGTFSISNLGMLDVDSFSAIILSPQSAVLAVGSVKKAPVVDDNDQVVVRQRMKATISVDHRVSDGAEGARFLIELKRLLEYPVTLVL